MPKEYHVQLIQQGNIQTLPIPQELNLKTISKSTLKEICHRWQIKELALFGSILRSDFNTNSDIDILVTFSEEAVWSLWDIVRLKNEFKYLFGKDIDLVEKSSLSNPFIRHEILKTKKVIYESN